MLEIAGYEVDKIRLELIEGSNYATRYESVKGLGSESECPTIDFRNFP